MKTLIATAAAALVLSSPAFAQGKIDPAVLLAMSNNSAAEIMLGETSSGDITRAQMRFALGNMSSAEREVFFKADEQTRADILKAQVFLMDGDSAAEAVGN